MISRQVRFNRRRFIFTTATAATGLGLAGLPVPRVRAASPAESPNNRPRVALIGCGGMGRANARICAEFGDIVALCDVDANRLADTRAKDWPEAKTFADFRDVMVRDDIDAIICGTQDHWHALISIAAMRAGKDVYCEKPLTLTVEEGREMVKVARETKRVLQTGSQQRSDQNFRNACELVRNGRVGTLRTITTLLPMGPRRGPFFEEEIPEGLNWNMWLGPREMTDYIPQKCHGSFRYWYDYSGGTMTDWGAHHNDIALWALGLDDGGPVEIEGRSLTDMVPGGFTAASEYEVNYRYANGVKHVCRSVTNRDPGGNPVGPDADKRGHGVLFEGDDGWIFVTRGKIEASAPELLSTPLPSNATRLIVSDNHQRNFFDCMRTRERPICDVEIGHRAATVCHLGVIAIRTGQKIKWDPERERITNNRALNHWLQRPMRGPWRYDNV